MKNCCENYDNEIEKYIHSLQEHMDLSVECNLCQQKTNSIPNHLRNKHPNEYVARKSQHLYSLNENHCCKYCDFSGYKQNLIRHVRNKHYEQDVECDECGKILKYSALYFHKLSVHSEKTYQFECQVCSQKFKHKHTFQTHLKTQQHLLTEKRKNVDDEKLENQFSQTFTELFGKQPQEHQKNDNKIYRCKHCDKTYSSYSSLYRHIKTHQEPQYSCNICDKPFYRSDKLKRHIRNVHNPVFVECPYCHQKYRERELKERHLKLCVAKSLGGIVPGISNHERKMRKFLRHSNISFEAEKRFSELSHLRFDFYLPEYNTIIEVHGKQHYQPYNHFGGQEKFRQTCENDETKKKFAISQGFTYFCIDTRNFDKELDKLKTKLKRKINLTNKIKKLMSEEFIHPDRLRLIQRENIDKPREYGNMSQRISERESAKKFWAEHKQDYLSTRSIKAVFQAYKEYTIAHDLPLLNEYLFRTFIRKNGYNNSIAEKDIPIVEAKKQAKKEERQVRKEWLKNMTPEEKEAYDKERDEIRKKRREIRKQRKLDKRKKR